MRHLTLPLTLAALLSGCQAPTPLAPAVQEAPVVTEKQPAKLAAPGTLAVEQWGVSHTYNGYITNNVGNGTFVYCGVGRVAFTVPANRVLRINQIAGWAGIYAFMQAYFSVSGAVLIDGAQHVGTVFPSGAQYAAPASGGDGAIDVIVGPGQTVVLDFGVSYANTTYLAGYTMSLDAFMSSGGSVLGVK